MKERTTKPASPTRLGMQSLRNIWQRLSVALMLVMLTMTVQTAGAQTNVSNAAGLAAAFYDQDVSVINVTDNITGVGNLSLDRTLTINLNGHTISGDGLNFYVYEGCSLTINGEGQGGSVGNIISGYAEQNAIDNSGTVTLSHVNITTNSDHAILGGTLNIGDNVSFNGWTDMSFNTEDVNMTGNYYYDPGPSSANVVATVTVGGKTHYFENIGAALAYITNNAGKVDFSWSKSDYTYTIHTATGWDLFCDMLEGGETFSDKTVELANDITVTRMAGGQPFTGTFDGDGHTLTVQYGTPSEPVNQQFVAPFPVVEGAATFRNLTIAGSIYVDYTTTDENPQPGVGGLIGHLFGGVTIEGCTSTVEITSTRDRVGGFVGLCEHSVSFTDCVSSAVVHYSRAGNISGFVGWSRASEYTISFEGCLFNGKLLLANGQWYGGGFVGWKGDGKTVNITNCLYAPPIAADEKYESGGATFCSQHDDKNPAVITNCYYTHTLGAAQGKQAHTVTAGTDVTVAHAGVATHYATSGITAYKATGASTDSAPFIAGLLYNNNVVDVLYAGSDDVVSLRLSSTATGAAGYQYAGYTTNAGTLSGSTLTMPDEDVTVSPTLRSTGKAVPVTYVDADGNTVSGQTAIALDGTETNLGVFNHEMWYFVGLPTVAFDHRLTLNGDVHLILADGCTMNVTNSKDNGIDINGSLTIYGQTDGTGTLTATGSNGIYTSSGTITISGGRVTATGGNGISTLSGTINISGGRVTATGEKAAGINTNSGTITLGCTTASDFIYASSYFVGLDGTLKIADGQTLYDEDGNSYSGTLHHTAIHNGVTLRPLRNVLALYDSEDNSEAISGSNGQQRNVILYDRTLYKDGAWNTLCLPFDVELEGSPLDGATAKTVIGTTTSGNDLTINFGNPDSATEPVTVLKAGVPYIIKWEATNTNIVEPVFTGVTVVSSTEADRTVSVLDGDVKFVGYYDALSLDPAGSDDFAANVVPSIYYMTADNTLKHTGVARTLHTCRAYFQFDETDPNVGQSRQFILNFGDDATGVAVIDNGKLIMDNEAGAVYDLQGRKVNGRWSMVNGQWSMVNGQWSMVNGQLKKGLYIFNGKKIVVK